MGYLDTAVGTATKQLRQVAGAVVNRTGHREQSQSVTIRSDRKTVQQLFQDPGRLSEVLGDIAEVQHTGGDDHFRWVFRQGSIGRRELGFPADRRLRSAAFREYKPGRRY